MDEEIKLMKERIAAIIERLNAAGIETSEEQGVKFFDYFEYLVRYNEKVNLTSITEFDDVVTKHFIDSVLPFLKLEIPEGACFVDVGSGGGFPALPLMIWRNDLKGTLCESVKKKCDYLFKASFLVSANAQIVHKRAEDLGRGKLRETFDFATARAVAALPTLCEYCIPLVKVGGRFIALKSVNEDVSAAENAVKALGGEIESVTDYKLPNSDDRRVVIIKKIAATPKTYPRLANKIKKSPL